MANINDYLQWRGELTLDQSPLNEIDKMILSRFSYIPFRKIKMQEKETIGSICEKLKKFKEEDFNIAGDMPLVHNLVNSNRFKDMEITDYEENTDPSAEKQFAAITIHLGNGEMFVSFCGTDNSLVGWKEDFTLGYHFPIISQKYAINYLNEVITSEDKEIYIGGHSKGGNLAMTSSMYCNNDIFKRIKTIYNLDGPGFREKDLNDNFKKILPKLQIYIPEDSIIGMLLYSTNNKKIVKSNTSGIMTHDINTWLCFGQFLEKGKQSKLSIKIDNRIKEWNKNYTDKELEVMITSIFNVFEKNNIKSFRELKKLKWNQIVGMINEVNDIDDETKKLYSETIKDLIWLNNKK